jgi:hypothetical protein
MLRKRAIRSLLVEGVAGLRLATPAGEAAERALRDEHEALERAERKALLMVGFGWLALVALFLLRDRAEPFLPMGATVDTVFTLGVLVVAIHSGFRLGQLEKYRAVRRVWDELAD